MKTEFDNSVICEGCSDDGIHLKEGNHCCYGNGCPCCDGGNKVLEIITEDKLKKLEAKEK